MLIAVDIDDVLAQFNKLYFELYNKQNGTSYRLEDHEQYYYNKTLGGELQEHIERVREIQLSEEGMNMLVHDHAFEALTKLSEKHELVAITARIEAVRGPTLAWINKHFPGLFKEVHFTGQFDPTKKVHKSEICKKIGASYMIEDALHHAVDCSQAGIQVILHKRPWNSKLYSELADEAVKGNITVVEHWEDVPLLFDN